MKHGWHSGQEHILLCAVLQRTGNEFCKLEKYPLTCLHARTHGAPGNTNPYIWASWGYLEYRSGNVTRARKLFDAAIVVDETHAAAWHKWGMLEMRQGNFLRARCGTPTRPWALM